MENLLKALNVIYAPDIQSKFRDIAEKLMYNYIIKKDKSRFAIVEIEFYYYSPNHPDIITYPRKSRCGRWFFHQNGVDLTFDSESTSLDNNGFVTNSEEAIFGGILIRGLYDIDNPKYTFGPQKCVDILWQDLGALSELDGYPTIERVPEGVVIQRRIQEYKRCINIKQDKEIAKVKEWAKRVGKKVDEMLDADLKNEFYKIINAKYRFFNLQNGENPTTFTQIPSKARP